MRTIALADEKWELIARWMSVRMTFMPGNVAAAFRDLTQAIHQEQRRNGLAPQGTWAERQLARGENRHP